MPIIAIYDWSLYTTSLTQSELEVSTHGNDPAQTGSNPYNPAVATWTGVDFTFNGGAASVLHINDDDAFFEDGYVETGSIQTLAQDITINGVNYFAGDEVQNEFSLLDSGLEVWVVRINGVNVGFAYPQGVPPTLGQVFNADDTRDGDPPDSLDQTTGSKEAYTDILCFAEGTMILTPDGERPVESLKPGDLVVTLDRMAQPIRWTRRDVKMLDCATTDEKPVLIEKGALGANRPADDLIVSPQHRVLVGGAGQLHEIFAREALVPAKSLTVVPRIRHMKGKTRITWIHFAFDWHEVVMANGCLSESLLLGPMVVNGLHAAERRTLTDIFGVASTPDAALNGPPARERLTAGAVKRQLAKHLEEKGRPVAKEIKKWDRDYAMEKYETERIREAKAINQVRMKNLA